MMFLTKESWAVNNHLVKKKLNAKELIQLIEIHIYVNEYFLILVKIDKIQINILYHMIL